MRPLVIATLLLGLTAGCAQAFPEPPPVDSTARGVLDDVAKAYKALPAYSDRGEFALSVTVDGKPQKQSYPLNVTFARPNKLDLKTDAVRVVSDGKNLITSVAPLSKYTSGPAPKAITFDTFREGPTGSVLFGGPSGPPMYILLHMLVSDDPVKAVLGLGGTLRVEGDREVDGKKLQALRIEQEEGPDYRILIDPETKLLAGIDLVVDLKELAKNAPEGQKIEVEKFGWTPGAVSTKEPAADAFAYAPPKDFAKIDSFAEEAQGDQDLVMKLVGAPSPDFQFTAYDGPGKTKTLSKADLAGKVVMIDFWATWCGPCLAELPEVQKMIESYAEQKKDVVIVALSQDSRPAEPVAVRKLIEETLEKKEITLTGTPVGIVGHDPDGTVGEAFHVTGLPTVVILDGKGVVQSVHVGYNADVRQALTKDIDTLLSGKALVELKPVEAAGDGADAKAKADAESK